MKKRARLLSSLIALSGLSMGQSALAAQPPEGCIVSLETQEKYCLPVGQRSGYSLPGWIRGHKVYVQAAEGAAVMLSDFDNLSYNHLAVFSGTVTNQKLVGVKAFNGQTLDFSRPHSMRVVKNTTSLGCIVSLETDATFCLPPGERSGYALPSWIKGQEVYVQAPEGTAVILSDYDNLSYNRLAKFSGTVTNNQLVGVKSFNGQTLDFSTPHSMRVIKDDEPFGCIISLETQEKYCLPVGNRSEYSLPAWIRGHEVYVQASQGAAVMLSDLDDLSDNRLAVFSGTVTNDKLVGVMANNGQALDFSTPKSMRVIKDTQSLGCIVSLKTDAKFCLPVGQRSGYSLPSWIKGHEVYVQAPEGAAVMLSDWDNLSYNRLAIFSGTTTNQNLSRVKAFNGETLDFSAPHSMRVVMDDNALGCIISVESNAKFCLPVGKRSGYSLPSWIKGQEVYVQAPEGTAVMLSDWDNLSYNRLAKFTGTVINNDLSKVKAYNGATLDFSRPRSMRVLSDLTPLGCIISLETDAKYCLPIGKRSGYALPNWIYDHEVSVQASGGAAVMLSDYDNLSYNRLATFSGTVSNADLVEIRANNNQILDFSSPHSMRVVQDIDQSETLSGGINDDIIYAGAGHDVIKGNNGNDTLYGDRGDDIINGGNGDDKLYGGSGNDQLFGASGNDALYGGPGNDILQAGYGNDSVMEGGTGFDLYIGSEGNDTMTFDQEDFSNEAFLTDNGSIYVGNRGFDKLHVNGDAHIDFSGTSYVASGTALRTKVIAQVEAVIGDAGDQTVIINANAIAAHSNNVQTLDNVNPGDWNGFVALLGQGNDTFNLEAGIWAYDENASASVPVTDAMIAFMALSPEQVLNLHPYVFSYAAHKITVWTDANTVLVDGKNLQ